MIVEAIGFPRLNEWQHATARPACLLMQDNQF
jgi:hypothetical protein